jgi:lipopolysaccharide/colanic/teichoic acid biosynthesis glycosyltransferase
VTTPLLVGEGHVIHPTARLSGPVVIHAEARIDEHVRVVGPAVVGRGVHIGARAVVAHSVVAGNATVPSGTVARNRVWCQKEGGAAAPQATYGAELARALACAPAAAAETAFEHQEKPNTRHLPLKRAFDATASGTALLLLSPILLIVAAAVWLESRGPVFYGDKREGFGGREFRCWKFRTMVAGAHAAQKALKGLDKMDGPHFKLDHDPRVTRVGRVLRALNLDELPQLFNVLVGEMSLVGPRPSPFRENQVCVPWREARLSDRLLAGVPPRSVSWRFPSMDRVRLTLRAEHLLCTRSENSRSDHTHTRR